MRPAHPTLLRLLSLTAWLAWAAQAGAPPAEGAGHGFVELNGGRFFYQCQGAGTPVVLIHGAQLDCRVWEDQLEAFSRAHRVLRYDLRGCGGSSLPEAPFSHEEDLAALLEHLGVSRAHLVGLSLGAMVAADFALAYPERVLSLTLAGPGLTGFYPESAEEVARYRAELRTARDESPDSLAALWLADPLLAPAMEQPRLAPLVERMARENRRSWLANWKLQRTPRPPTAARLGEIRVPTLLLAGARDLPSVLATVDTLARGLPMAERMPWIEGSGHLVCLERPAEFNQAVLAFLRRQEERAGH